MNKIMTSTTKRVTLRGLSLVACIVVLAMQAFTPSPAVAATSLPVLWTAGGLSAGIDSAGQAGRIAADGSGNVAVVSGPSGGRDLAVTSYAATGSFRWRSVVSPSSGTFVGDSSEFPSEETSGYFLFFALAIPRDTLHHPLYQLRLQHSAPHDGARVGAIATNPAKLFEMKILPVSYSSVVFCAEVPANLMIPQIFDKIKSSRFALQAGPKRNSE